MDIRYVEKYVEKFWGSGNVGRNLLVIWGCGKLCGKVNGGGFYINKEESAGVWWMPGEKWGCEGLVMWFLEVS